MNLNINWEKVGNMLPVIVQHWQNYNVLMLGYANPEALELTLSTKKVHFFSRTKNRIWMKGEVSKNILEVVEIKHDCDNDTLLIFAKPAGVVCHIGTDTCFGNYNVPFLQQLEGIIVNRIKEGGENSYIAKLVSGGINRVAQKVGEEGVEVAIAAIGEDEKLIDEAADLLFHLLILLNVKGLNIDDILLRLQERNRKSV